MMAGVPVPFVQGAAGAALELIKTTEVRLIAHVFHTGTSQTHRCRIFVAPVKNAGNCSPKYMRLHNVCFDRYVESVRTILAQP
jgi:hypothetical protein